MVELKLQNEKHKNNQRNRRPSKQRKLNVEAQVLTSAEGKQLAAEKDAEQAAKEQKKKDMAMWRKQKENEREQQQQDRAPDTPFTGALSSKSKPDLQEIAGALSLAEEGTKEVLILFFESHPHLRDTERFMGLFNCAHRQQIVTNGATQAQISSHSGFPLTANVANLPIAGPSTSHNTFTAVQPNHSQINFYPLETLHQHYHTNHPLLYPPLHSLSNIHSSPQPISTNLAHTSIL